MKVFAVGIGGVALTLMGFFAWACPYPALRVLAVCGAAFLFFQIGYDVARWRN